jgi:hypothetical protein
MPLHVGGSVVVRGIAVCNNKPISSNLCYKRRSADISDEYEKSACCVG